MEQVKNKPDESGLVPPDDDRYSSNFLPAWVCPECGKAGGYEIEDAWEPVRGAIAIECASCEYLEM
jgi:hypothetical protein